ncbi:MAG: PAS domain S-box protein [Deltaproteobacteria bacterium]|nr:PAS domain S-box protein [Deltaproteobacteria bacterium]
MITTGVIFLFRRRVGQLDRIHSTLLETEGRYRDLVEGSVLGIVIHRRHSPLFVNQAFAQMHGFESVGEVMEMPSLTDLMALHERERVVSYNAACLEDREGPTTYEFQAVTKDGKMIWRENRIMKIQWEGRPALQVVTTDITDRKRVEEELRESRHRLENLIEGSLQGMMITSRGKILFVNPALVSMFGFKSALEMLVLPNALDRVAPEDYHMVNEAAKSLYRGEQNMVRYEARSFRKDGTPMTVEIFSRKVTWDRQEVIQSTVFDVTDRKKAEQALAESQAYLANILGNAVDGIITIDASGTIETFNKAAQRMFGYDLGETMGQNVKMLMPEPERGRHDGYLEAYLKTGHKRIIGIAREVTALRKDGTTFPLYLAVSEVWRGTRQFFTAVVHDLTEIHETRVQMLEANKAKDRFLSNMSHELRTPLNGILGFAQLLLRDASLSAQQRKNIGVIANSGHHLLELINEVLDISKIEAGKFELKQEDFNLPELLTGMVDLFTLRCAEKGLAFTHQFDGNLPMFIHGDKGKLRQVLINLLGNAVKFTTQGEIVLSARMENGKGRFSVKDSGMGIPLEFQEKIMEPFQQVPHTSVEGGVGLGLSISSRIVDGLGGKLEVISRPGEGAEFYFSIPLMPVQAEFKDRNIRGKRVTGLVGTDTWRVLVVDDDWRARHALSQLLHSVGFVAKESEHGEQALRDLPVFQPDLIFLDINMPIKNGIEVLQAIRANPEIKDLPVVAFTASAWAEDMRRLTSHGFNAVVTKPYREESIFQALADCLKVSFTFETLAADHQRDEQTPLDLAQVGKVLTEKEKKQFRKALLIGDLNQMAALAHGLETKHPDPETSRFLLRVQELAKTFQENELTQIFQQIP